MPCHMRRDQVGLLRSGGVVASDLMTLLAKRVERMFASASTSHSTEKASRSTCPCGEEVV